MRPLLAMGPFIGLLVLSEFELLNEFFIFPSTFSINVS